MKNTILALLALASGVLLVPTLTAQTPSQSRRALVVDRFDENGDGQLDRAEFRKLRRFMSVQSRRRGQHPGATRPGSNLRGPRPPRLAGEGPLPGGPDRLRQRPPRGGRGGNQAGPGSKRGPGRQGQAGKRGNAKPSREALLEKYDTDGNGKLDRDERKQLRADRKANRKANRKARSKGGKRPGPGQGRAARKRQQPGQGPDKRKQPGSRKGADRTEV